MVIFFLLLADVVLSKLTAVTFSNGNTNTTAKAGDATTTVPTSSSWPTELDTKEYNARLLALSGFTNSTLAERIVVTSTTGTTTELKYRLVTSSTTNTTIQGQTWPAANFYPNGGALLPFHRIVAYYGNFLSRYMGILGELPRNELITHLRNTVMAWEKADPNTPVIPAIHYIAMVAQGSAGADNMYRAVMPDEEIEKAYELAHEVDGVLFLDLQVGRSTLPEELPKFRTYLERPDVHLGIDPEFSMKGGQPPGTVIGTYDASDINYAIDWLTEIVRNQHLPPKILVVHRFTQDMITNYKDIEPTPEVQVVIDMDGWGSKELKSATYHRVIVPEPVEFTGIKLFYKNDLKPPSTGMYTPEEVLEFTPKPIYIQYQ